MQTGKWCSILLDFQPQRNLYQLGDTSLVIQLKT